MQPNEVNDLVKQFDVMADMMKRVAAPVVGGLATSFLLELLIYPAIYCLWKWKSEMREGRAEWIRMAANPNG